MFRLFAGLDLYPYGSYFVGSLRILASPPPGGSVPAVALCLPRGDGVLLRRPSPRIPPPLAVGSRVAPAGACGFAAGGEGSPTAREGVKEGR